MNALRNASRRAWQAFRTVLGDDAYERYVAHVGRHHPGSALLTRAEFQRTELDRRWSQINRCC